ncbi:endoplasmic oxidoreductin [Microthyrium microscopicum]|uniref:Endoplasmic oxidoreductin n=1 Tax=Microthyrium microscopicum TaxID=703497 RepID=A0A6A6USI3_9PEZI|nr:endoplasmic oxidoreductin [Microthyrium microscopicum]
MRSARQVFYLAVFALWGSSAHAESSNGKQAGTGSDVCAYEPNSIVSDACVSYSSLDSINAALSQQLQAVTLHTDFFSHYRLNLYNKKCPFWTDESGTCGNIACAVNTIENEEDIPLSWRAEELGKLQGPKAEHPGKKLQKERAPQKPLQGQLGEDVGESCVVEYDDECDERDYCVPEDERATSKGDYVSLTDNPERFTGYSGPSSQQVWGAIYRENCFSKPAKNQESTSMPPSFGPKNPFQAQAANDLFSVMKEGSMQQGVKDAIANGLSMQPIDQLEFDQECVEKRVFHRVVSGMHASISTHLCYDFLNQTTGEWGPNAECFKSRVLDHPERISNLYFNYALLLRAVGKINKSLKDYTFCSADPSQNARTKMLVVALSDTVKSSGEIFDESIMFQSPDAIGLKEDFKQRFRNISRVMDCVGCDKCRLWGKLQTNGYGTALKILFEFDEKNPRNNPPLRRTELVALMNTLGKVSNSLSALQYFRSQIEESSSTPNVTNSAPKQNASEKSRPERPKLQTVSDAEDEADDYPNFNRRNDPDMSIMEIFREEFGLVYRVFRYIIGSWLAFPQKAWHIVKWEFVRFWHSFVGLQAGERGWSIYIPHRDEL